MMLGSYIIGVRAKGVSLYNKRISGNSFDKLFFLFFSLLILFVSKR